MENTEENMTELAQKVVKFATANGLSKEEVMANIDQVISAYVEAELEANYEAGVELLRKIENGEEL